MSDSVKTDATQDARSETKPRYLRPIKWVETDGKGHVAFVMGAMLCAYEHNGKYSCRLVLPNTRPEIETQFLTLEQAKQHAETVLLEAELAKYFY